MTNLRDVISQCKGVIVNHTFLINKFIKSDKPADPYYTMDDKKAAANNSTKEAYMATAFLSGLNQCRYGVLLNDLHNTFWMGLNEYPNTLAEAYDLAIKLKVYTKGPIVAPNDGMDFATEL